MAQRWLALHRPPQRTYLNPSTSGRAGQRRKAFDPSLDGCRVRERGQIQSPPWQPLHSSSRWRKCTSKASFTNYSAISSAYYGNLFLAVVATHGHGSAAAFAAHISATVPRLYTLLSPVLRGRADVSNKDSLEAIRAALKGQPWIWMGPGA